MLFVIADAHIAAHHCNNNVYYISADLNQILLWIHQMYLLNKTDLYKV